MVSDEKSLRTGNNAAIANGASFDDSPFMRACRRERNEVTPIWLMRQAGRFMPEYRKIREKVSFLELCKNSQLAAEVTVTAVQELGVDAAIIFADILLPIEALNAGLVYAKGDGPVIERPVRTADDVRALRRFDPAEELGYVAESVRIARRELPPSIPLIGFAGAPFTVASYLIEGGSSRHFEQTKRLMYREPQAWHELMELLSGITSEYLNAQIDAGAQVVQLFDSWVGCLGQSDYEKYVLPYARRTISGVYSDVPVIHFGTGTSSLLPLMAEAGGDVIGVDWRIEIDQAWDTIPNKCVQGNLDPIALMGGFDFYSKRTEKILGQIGGRPGHIFNLGHGILPSTDPDDVKRLVEFVHSWRPSKH